MQCCHTLKRRHDVWTWDVHHPADLRPLNLSLFFFLFTIGGCGCDDHLLQGARVQSHWRPPPTTTRVVLMSPPHPAGLAFLQMCVSCHGLQVASDDHAHVHQ